MLFTLDTAFLHERQRELQAGEGGGRLARALGRPGGARRGLGWSPGHNKLAERKVKNTAGVASGEKKNTARGSVRRTLTCFVPEVKITAGRLGGRETGPNMFSAKPGPRTVSVRKSSKNAAQWEGPESPLGWAESKKALLGPCPRTPAGLGGGAGPGPENTAGARWALFCTRTPSYLVGYFFGPGCLIQLCVWGPAKGVRRAISYLHQNPPHVYYWLGCYLWF